MAAYPRTRFAVEIVPDRERVILAPAGELDLANSDALWEQFERIRENGFGQIVLDLRKLTFIDSSGLRLILRAHAIAQRDGFEFKLIDGAEPVCRVLDLTGLREHLQFTHR